jgi:hypothetical protein
MKNIIASIALLAITGFANAAETYVDTISGQYGQVRYTPTAEGWVYANVFVDGAGVNRTAKLNYVSYSFVDGYKAWFGSIPEYTVVTTGVSSISVDVDTCAVEPVNSRGCGPVNFTVSTSEPASGWVNNGVVAYEYSDLMVRYVGANQVRESSASGMINGQTFDNARAFSGTSDNVYVQVTVGN